MFFNKKNIVKIIDSANSKKKINGKTHTFYRYPAAFSPIFAETIINIFTKPSDVILDPFVGGGTSAVEAFALQRKFYGIDVNPLSVLVSKVKTTILSYKKIIFIKKFNEKIVNTKINFKSKRRKNHSNLGHYFNTKNFSNEEIRKINQIKAGLEQYHFASNKIKDVIVRNFLTCLLLRTTKNILDNVRPIGSFKKFKLDLVNNCNRMLSDMVDFEKELEINKSIYGSHNKVKILKSDILKLRKINSLKKGKIKLIFKQITEPFDLQVIPSNKSITVNDIIEEQNKLYFQNEKPP